MKIKELLDALKDVPLDAEIVFQGNVFSDDDIEDCSENPSYTTCYGPVFSAWHRESSNQFVLDSEVKESE